MCTISCDKRLAAWLDLIAASEGTSSSPFTKYDGYDVIVSGIDGPHVFTDFSTHPFTGSRAPVIVRAGLPAREPVTAAATGVLLQVGMPAVRPLLSTASGRYQIIFPTWHTLAAKYNLNTFSPQAQDCAALHLLDECHATELILAANVPAAIKSCSETWASFPGNNYQQGGRTVMWLSMGYTRLLAEVCG